MPPAKGHLIFVGTYTKSSSRGIYSFRLDPTTGALSAAVIAAETTNPSFLALSPGGKFLYAVHDSTAMAKGFSIDAMTGGLSTLPNGAAPPAGAPSHIAADRTGRALVVTHFGSGFVAAIPLRTDGGIGAPPTVIPHRGRGTHPVRQSEPHVHSVTLSPDNRFALVCDLGLDKIFSYSLDPATPRLLPAETPWTPTAPGSGPRHSAFSPDGRHLYVINEMAGTIAAYAYDGSGGTLAFIGVQPTLPAHFQGENTTAEVRVHPNGKFVYGSNRGHDSLAVFARDVASGALTPVEIVPCGGRHPRNFALSPDGSWLVCAHMHSDTLAVFRIDASTGRLSRVGGTVSVPMPSCVLFYD